MSKLVDRERLARLAAALDARMKAAVKAEEERAMNVEAGLQAAIDAINHAENGILKQANAYTDEKIAEIDEINGNVADNIGDLQEKDEELAQAIADNKAVLDRLDGAEGVEGSVKKQIKDAIDAVNQAADGLGDRVEALENFKDVTYPAAEAKVREDFAAADAQVLADAQKYADDAITALVDSAPDAMNTLNELAEAISANKGVYDAYVEQHAAAMTKMKEDLQAEIDADVEVVQKALDAEKERVAGVEAGFEARIAANEAFVAAQPAVDEAQQEAIDDLVGRMEAMEAFEEAHDHSVMEQGIADNKAAIEKEVEDRDAAIAEALEAYSDTEEVKGMLTNVINSLGLAIVENKLQLTLGTSDFVIKEVELDMATDEDIDAIIAGLDAPAGE